jgi:hypothetical protein
LLWTGKLAGQKVGGRWRIPLSAVEERSAAQKVRNGPALVSDGCGTPEVRIVESGCGGLIVFFDRCKLR